MVVNSANKQDKLMLSNLKEHGLSMNAPLLLDTASLGAYLLDDTDVRVRLELANESWVLNTHQDGNSFKFNLDSAKLWVDRIVPWNPSIRPYITINGSSVYHIHNNFAYHVSGLFYATLKGLGLETNNNLSLSAFVANRTICAFNLVTEDVDNGIPLDKTGNMRVQLTFNQGRNRNLVIIFFANTTGVIEIDTHRQVTCQVSA